MGAIAFSDFSQNLARHLDEVAASRAPLVVTRQGREAMVVLSASEFEGMQETLHLLESPVNAARLLRSIASLDRDEGVEHALVDEDESGATDR